jgi:hypothetical protein
VVIIRVVVAVVAAVVVSGVVGVRSDVWREMIAA